VANGTEFQEKVRQLGQLIMQFDQMPENHHKTACKQLVQLLMDVHGAGLDRMMEIVFENEAAGPAIVDKLGQDSITSSLLLLYSLHPDDLETRIHKALERMRPRLRAAGQQPTAPTQPLQPEFGQGDGNVLPGDCCADPTRLPAGLR